MSRRSPLSLCVATFYLLLQAATPVQAFSGQASYAKSSPARTTPVTSSTALWQQKQPRGQDDENNGSSNEYQMTMSRRRLLAFIPAIVLGTSQAATAVVVEQPKEKIFIAGQAMGVPAAKERFLLARKTLKDILANYNEIKQGGGDNIRRYLGVVGTTSALYGITKVMKELQEEADDIVEYTENMSDFDSSLRAADTSAYSAIFVEFSAAKGTSEDFFRAARTDIERMQVHMDLMAAELNLK